MNKLTSKSDLGPEGRKIDSHNLTPLRGWAHDGDKTPAFGRGYILTALRGLFILTFTDLKYVRMVNSNRC